VLHLYLDKCTEKCTWAYYDPNGFDLFAAPLTKKFEAIQGALEQLYPGIVHDEVKQYECMPFILGLQAEMFGQGNGGFCALLSLTRCHALAAHNDTGGAAEAILKKAAWQAKAVFDGYKKKAEDQSSSFAFFDFDKFDTTRALEWWDDYKLLQAWAKVKTNQERAQAQGFTVNGRSKKELIKNAILAVQPQTPLTPYEFCDKVKHYGNIADVLATRSFGCLSSNEGDALNYVQAYIEMLWDLRKSMFNLLENTGEGWTPEKRAGPAVRLARDALRSPDPESYLDDKILRTLEVESFNASKHGNLMSPLERKLADYVESDPALITRCLIRSPWYGHSGMYFAASLGLAGAEGAIENIANTRTFALNGRAVYWASEVEGGELSDALLKPWAEKVLANREHLLGLLHELCSALNPGAKVPDFKIKDSAVAPEEMLISCNLNFQFNWATKAPETRLAIRDLASQIKELLNTGDTSFDNSADVLDMTLFDD
jgi:hypothetical protein